MSNLLRHIDVEVRCEQCGEFTLPADVIAESQRLLAEGCPGSAHECPPALYATLLEPSALRALESAWRQMEAAARGPARSISVGDGESLGARPSDSLDPVALARWEDDGGSPRAAAASFAQEKTP